MLSLGYEKNVCEQCVFNTSGRDEVQCTAAVHVDNLLITSIDEGMINTLCDGLKNNYGDITRCDGPILNYVGMQLDLTFAGKARITMQGYVDDVLASSGTVGLARTPANDGLFEIRTDAVPVSQYVEMQ